VVKTVTVHSRADLFVQKSCRGIIAMIYSRRFVWVALIGAILIGPMGCSKKSTTVINADLPNLNDIATAPNTIQTAAKAVVRVRTARQSGTGFFISATGQLLTNNHVLGDTVCPVEGCYIEITFMHQKGQLLQQPMIVFAVPVAVDAGLDMAIVQLFNSPGGAKLDSPDYLTFNSQNSPSLIGKHITIVGHPEGYLKKWTDGVVINASGQWFQTTAYILPGDSGSPALDDEGKIVGLIHRGPTSQDLFTNNSANVYSIGTASEAIIAALTAPLPNTMILVTAATTTDNFLANDLVYLNARMTSVNTNGASVSALSLLGSVCDTALARTDFMSPDDLQSALLPCYDAQTWIECRADGSTIPYGVVCPAGSDATDWENRFKSINQLWLNMNGQIDYYSVSFAIARLQPTMNAGTTAGAQALQQAIAGPKPVLDYLLANYLAAFNINSFNNSSIKDFIVNYQNGLHYELQATSIAAAGDWLWYYNWINKKDLLSLLSNLHSDPDVSLGTKLYVEELQYQLNAL
jgi:hypothetical protein